MVAGTSKGDRATLLLRCSNEEAELIRKAAKRERRTISGYILNAVLKRIAVRSRIEEDPQKTHDKGPNVD